MEKIWLKSYPQNTPAEINPDQYSSLAMVFERNCQKFANNVAFSNLGKTMTYAELEQKTKALAAYFQKELGLKKGDRVAIMMPNLLQYPIVLFAVLRAGLIVVNTNPLYTAVELAHQLKDSGAVAIVVIANFASVLEKALPDTQIKHVIVTEVGDAVGGLKSVLINWVVKYKKKMVPAWHIKGAIKFNDAIKKGQNLTFTPVDISGDDIAFLQYTGGTTGISKGAILTNRNMIANLLQCLTWIGNHVKENEETVIVALPLYHIFSLTICCLAFMQIGGHGILITNPRDIPGFIKELKKTPFTVFVGVNTLFNALINRPEFAQLDFSKLHISVSGGMAMQRAVAEKWHKITGNYILEGYGLTEASPVVTVNPTYITSFTGSIGLPIPSTDIKVCDEEGNEVAIGESGELYVKGPQVMRGYWNRDAETSSIVTPEGWLRTGDVVRVDEKGFVYMVDRKKDMIIVSGFNVYPTEIEDVIAAHPKVLEVGVIGVPSEVTGETVKAFIVKKDHSLTEQEILDFCHERLTRYKVPKIISFRNELPKTNVGKILRRKLRDLD